MIDIDRNSTRKPQKLPKQDLAVKIFHSLNIVSLFLMITSGLQIYNANPVLVVVGDYTFPLFLL